MIFIVIIACLVAAFLNAVAAIVQRQAAGKRSADELFHKDFIAAVTTNKLWLVGGGVQVLAFLLQALALGFGSLVLVEPLLITDLIFLLLILHFKLHLPAGKQEWSAVVLICVGLSVLLAAAHPRGGHLEFSGFNWGLTVVGVAAIVLISIFVIRRSPSARLRAGLGGLAAGVAFALTAAFTKLSMQQLSYGFGNLFSSWEVYALMAVGALSIIIMQSAYAAGPLAISQPIIEITDPLASAVIGILLFGDTISVSAPSLAGEVVGALLAAAGVILMSTSRHIHQLPT